MEDLANLCIVDRVRSPGLTLRKLTDQTPWFRARPGLTVVVAAALFAAVFILRLFVGDAADAVNMLNVLPISLVALAFGLRAGLGSGLLAVGLLAAWVQLAGVELSTLGWVSRTLPMLLLGALLGDASDRLHLANLRRRALEAAAQRHRDAVEINDTLVQGMAAAKWSVEAGRHEAGLATLSQTLELGQELVSNLLRDADMGFDGRLPPPQASPVTAPDRRADRIER